MRFEGRNVLVTGAGSGFGKRIAERFADEGARHLYLVDYKPERLDHVAGGIADRGAVPHKISIDLSVWENCEAAIAEALEVDPKLDVLVSNAAA